MTSPFGLVLMGVGLLAAAIAVGRTSLLGLLFIGAFGTLLVMLGTAQVRMRRAVRRSALIASAAPTRGPRLRDAGWTAPPPLSFRMVDDGHAPVVSAPSGVAVLFLWVFDKSPTISLLNRVNRIGPVYLLRGGGLLVQEVTELPRIAFGRIDRMIEETEAEVRQRLADFRVQRRLGYYRQCAVACTDGVWTFALDRLLERCPVVLVDLSDFAPGRAGITFELGVLLDRVDLRRVVFVSGPATDLAAVRLLLDEIWSTVASTSPNRRGVPPVVTIACTRELVDHGPSRDGYSQTTHRDRELVASLIGEAAASAPPLPLLPPGILAPLRPLPPPVGVRRTRRPDA